MNKINDGKSNILIFRINLINLELEKMLMKRIFGMIKYYDSLKDLDVNI